MNTDHEPTDQSLLTTLKNDLSFLCSRDDIVDHPLFTPVPADVLHELKLLHDRATTLHQDGRLNECLELCEQGLAIIDSHRAPYDQLMEDSQAARCTQQKSDAAKKGRTKLEKKSRDKILKVSEEVIDALGRRLRYPNDAQLEILIFGITDASESELTALELKAVKTAVRNQCPPDDPTRIVRKSP